MGVTIVTYISQQSMLNVLKTRNRTVLDNMPIAPLGAMGATRQPHSEMIKCSVINT